jgi:hypothetical protein
MAGMTLFSSFSCFIPIPLENAAQGFPVWTGGGEVDQKVGYSTSRKRRCWNATTGQPRPGRRWMVVKGSQGSMIFASRSRFPDDDASGDEHERE